jgi:seryl-tRNA synthetase
MKFTLKGTIVLSKPLESPELKDDLVHFFKEANDNILTKGAPEGLGAKVDDWSLNNDKIKLTITSGKYVRSHDALLRLKKNLSQALGKKYKVGARAVTVDEYLIELELERLPINDFQLPFVTELNFNNDANVCSLLFKCLTEEFLRENFIDRIIKLVHDKIEDQYYAGKGGRWDLLWSSPRPEAGHVWAKDPTEEMLKLGWIKQGPTKGKWFYRTRLTKILRTMEKIAITEILEPLGFSEVIASHLVPFDIWLKTGHIMGTPNEFYYVSEPKTRDTDAWEHFRDYITITHQVPAEELSDLITIPNMGICYAQCPVLYWSLQGKVIAEESLPVLIYDRAANSNRYESGGRHGIERVDEFHRLEPIYLGHPEQLIELRDKFIERYKYVFNEILELEWRMAWVTPWYMEQAGQLSDESPDEKVKGTIDFEAYLPYRGTREDSEWLEYQNLSIIGDKFTKAFNIKTQHGDLWSGCSGIGLERWAAVFLAQKGLDPKDWPEKFVSVIGDLPVEMETK